MGLSIRGIPVTGNGADPLTVATPADGKKVNVHGWLLTYPTPGGAVQFTQTDAAVILPPVLAPSGGGYTQPLRMTPYCSTSPGQALILPADPGEFSGFVLVSES